MAYRITTAPASEPMTATEAKLSTRIDHSTEDTLVDEYIEAARVWVERKWDLAIIDQTVKETFDSIPESGMLELTVRPVLDTADVTLVQYYDENNDIQTFSSANYVVTLDGDTSWIELHEDASWPDMYSRKGVLVVTYIPGWATAGDVPTTIKTCLRQIVWDLYENRGTSPNDLIAMATEALLSPYIRRRL